MKAQTEAAWTELTAIVGLDRLRPALPEDAVDGVAAQMVVEPDSAEELAQVLRAANAAGLCVVPRGGGTKLSWGNLPRRVDLILSTKRLNQVLEHAWADMTATVEAGCTVEKFQRTLAEHRQRLALDPLWPEKATIGGILAANDSGALRVRFGALRDLIIGITLTLPDGTLAKSGGKVVKNVAGYDLPKLATGSLGTLGVITQAVFRLYPLPREERTVSFTAGSVDLLTKLMLAIQDSRLAFTGLQLRAQSSSAPQLDVRFEGTAAGIEAQVNYLFQLAKDVRPAESPSGTWTARQALWNGSQQTQSSAMIVKFSVMPAQLSGFRSLVSSLVEPLRLAWRIVAQAVGIGLLRMDGEKEPLLRALASVRTEMDKLGGSAIVLHCPPGTKPGLDVWGSAGDALPLMRRVKEQLDPAGTLNPGRFVGGI